MESTDVGKLDSTSNAVLFVCVQSVEDHLPFEKQSGFSIRFTGIDVMYLMLLKSTATVNSVVQSGGHL